MKTCRLTSSVRIGAPDSCRESGRVIGSAEAEVKGHWGSYLSPGVHVVVGLRRVDFGEQEASLETDRKFYSDEKTGRGPFQTTTLVLMETTSLLVSTPDASPGDSALTWLPPCSVSMYLGMGKRVCSSS